MIVENYITVGLTKESDYTNIVSAIKNAGKNCTIKLLEGTYIEDIVIEQNIKIIGKPGENPVIIELGALSSLKINNAEVVIENVTFHNIMEFAELSSTTLYDLKNCCLQVNGGVVSLINCRFSSLGGTGINSASETAIIKLEHCTFSNCYSAITNFSLSQYEILNCNILSCKVGIVSENGLLTLNNTNIDKTNIGIYAQNTNTNLLNTHFKLCDLAVKSEGYQGYIKIINTHFKFNKVGLYSSNQTIIKHSKFESNSLYGVYFESVNYHANDTIREKTLSDLLIITPKEATYNYDNKKEASIFEEQLFLYIFECYQCDFIFNTNIAIYVNGNIFIDTTKQIRITQSKIYGSKQGIIWNTLSGSIDECEITRNLQTGITIGEGYSPEINNKTNISGGSRLNVSVSDCFISENNHVGICFANNVSGYLNHCTIQHNGRDDMIYFINLSPGILVSRNAEIHITYCTIRNNGYSIRVLNNGYLTVTSSKIRGVLIAEDNGRIKFNSFNLSYILHIIYKIFN